MNNLANNRWLSVLILVLLTANIVTLALLWTQNKNDKGPGQLPQPGGQVFEFLTNELKLDAGQQEAYKKLREEHQAGIKNIRDDQRKAKEALFELLKQPNVPDSVIHAYSSRAAAPDQQLDEFTFRHFQKLRAICSAGQQKKFDEIIQDALRRMAPPKHMGPPPGRGGGDGPPPGQ